MSLATDTFAVTGFTASGNPLLRRARRRRTLTIAAALFAGSFAIVLAQSAHVAAQTQAAPVVAASAEPVAAQPQPRQVRIIPIYQVSEDQKASQTR